MNVEAPLEIPTAFRPAEPDDLSFLFNAWLRSYRDEGDNRHKSADIYYNQARPRIARALAQSVTVAHNPEDAAQIYGFICYRPPTVVHYVYVKYTFRHLGVARRLIGEATRGARPIIATHTGRAFEVLKRRYPVIYDPNQLEMP